MFKIKIEPGAKFDKQLKDGVSLGMIGLIEGRMVLRGVQITQEIGNYIINVFEQTDVVKSLRGNGSTDLQAHFGLSDSIANELVEGMVSIIRKSIRVAITADLNGTIKIFGISTDWEKYTGLPGAKYISGSSGIVVPVIEWMLVDPSIDIGQAAYEIVFKGNNSGKDARIEKVSRSGRAIMVSLQSLGGGGTGYVLPTIISKKGGANFIEFAIRQQGVARRCAEIVIEGIK